MLQPDHPRVEACCYVYGGNGGLGCSALKEDIFLSKPKGMNVPTLVNPYP